MLRRRSRTPNSRRSTRSSTATDALGRCLIPVVLRRRCVAPRSVPPVSIVLAARPGAYVEGLVGFREGRLADWIGSLAAAAQLAAAASVELAVQVSPLHAAWRERAGRPRADSAAAKLISLLPALPVLSAPTARGAIATSQQQTLAALKSLADAGVLRQISAGTYDRQYAADELFDLVSAYETKLAGGCVQAGTGSWNMHSPRWTGVSICARCQPSARTGSRARTSLRAKMPRKRTPQRNRATPRPL